MSDVTGPERTNATMARLRLALERELAPDEVVLWHGWKLGRVEPLSFGIYLFAIPWTAFSIMWTAMAAGAMASSGDDGPGWFGWAFPLFGLPFVAVGVGMLAGPFAPLLHKGRVLFVITDRRVIKLALNRALEVQAVPADRIGLVIRHEHRDGTGRLQLAIRIGKDSDGDRQTEYLAIGTVADVQGAHAALNRIAAPAPPPSAPDQIAPFSS